MGIGTLWRRIQINNRLLFSLIIFSVIIFATENRESIWIELSGLDLETADIIPDGCYYFDFLKDKVCIEERPNIIYGYYPDRGI